MNSFCCLLLHEGLILSFIFKSSVVEMVINSMRLFCFRLGFGVIYVAPSGLKRGSVEEQEQWYNRKRIKFTTLQSMQLGMV